MKNKFHTLNISTNYSSKRSIYPNYSSQRVNRKKTKKIKSFSPSTNNSTIFDPYEEYVSKLEYYNPDLMKTKKETLYNLNTSPKFPKIIKQTSANFNSLENCHNFLKEIANKKNIFEKKQEHGIESPKYEGRIENLNLENHLERERKGLESKIAKLKSLIDSLSDELSDTISEIENLNIELEFLKNYKSYVILDVNVRKKVESEEKKQNDKNNSSSLSLNKVNYDKNKRISKEINYEKELEIKMKMQTILSSKTKQVEIYLNKATQNLISLQNKKKNILIKLDACEKDLKDFKEKLLELKNDLLVHYHKLLSEGKDTRKEGLCWIIKAIWDLKSNVVLSYLPKFLDEKAVLFLFLYASKMIEINDANHKMEKLNDRMKLRGSVILNQINLAKLNIDKNLKNKNSNKSKKNIINKNSRNLKIESNSSDESVSDIEKNPNSIKNTIKIKVNDDDKKNITCNNNKNNKVFNNTNKNSNFGDTFKTSLYNTLNDDSENKNTEKNYFLSKENKKLKKPKTNLHNFTSIDKLFKKSFFKKGLANNKYIGTSFDKPIKIKDFENLENFRVIENIDSPFLNMFNIHKKMESQVEKLRNEAKEMQKKELDRISKCFYLEDYGGKYNVDQKTVIGALIGEENVRVELIRQEKMKKNYFKTIEGLRNFQTIKNV